MQGGFDAAEGQVPPGEGAVCEGRRDRCRRRKCDVHGQTHPRRCQGPAQGVLEEQGPARDRGRHVPVLAWRRTRVPRPVADRQGQKVEARPGRRERLGPALHSSTARGPSPQSPLRCVRGPQLPQPGLRNEIVGSHRTDSSTARGVAPARLVPALAVAMLCMCACASPAGALVAQLAGRHYGVTPIRSVRAESVLAAHIASPSRAKGATGVKRFDSGGAMNYEGGPVMHSVAAHVIYWDPGKAFSEKTKGIIRKFFTDVAHDSGLASNVFGVAGQYTDTSRHAAYSSAVGSEETDLEPYPVKSGCSVPEEGDPGPYSKCLLD